SAPAEWRTSLSAIAESDGVVIAGGGNLSQSWPAAVFERTAVVRAARRAGRPVAITGQTLGPAFDDRTRELTAALLRDAVFVGLREASSHALALALGAPRDRTVMQFDDATGVSPIEPPWWRDVIGDRDVIAVTLNRLWNAGDPEGSVAFIARQLVDVSRHTGATIVFVPHLGDLQGEPTEDVAMARAVAAAAGGSVPLLVTPLPTPAQAVWIAARAQLVVSTRYHPIVFAIAATTPALFLPQDHYTHVKGCGAMNLAGLGSWTLPVGAAAGGLLTPATLELWARRQEVREHLRGVVPAIETARRRHVDTLLSALAAPMTLSAGEPIAVMAGPVARGTWVEHAYTGGLHIDARSRRFEQQLASAEEYVGALRREVERKDAELVAAQAALADLTKATHEAHAAWQTDRDSLMRHCERLEERASTAEQWAGVLQKEVERKEAELVIAQAALEEAARQRRGEPTVPPDTEPESPGKPPHQS
ncbi:MAG TPA: polysaccharide pyruvyl transferase family protein, partial [Vicinamibacterales bacterium]